MATNSNTNTQTAADAYTDAALRIEGTMNAIKSRLAEHKAKAAKQPTYWTYVGDLQHVAGQMDELLAFLGGRK